MVIYDREKKELIIPNGLGNGIVVVEGEKKLQRKDVELNYWQEDIFPDVGYDGLSSVHTNAQEFWDKAEREGQKYVQDRLVKKTIIQNGNYYPEGEELGFTSVEVNVPQGQDYNDGYAAGYSEGTRDGQNAQKDIDDANLTDSINITKNGTYKANYGYKEVVVAVPQSGGEGTEISIDGGDVVITENGRYWFDYKGGTKDFIVHFIQTTPEPEPEPSTGTNLWLLVKSDVGGSQKIMSQDAVQYVETPMWVDGVWTPTSVYHSFTAGDPHSVKMKVPSKLGDDAFNGIDIYYNVQFTTFGTQVTEIGARAFKNAYVRDSIGVIMAETIGDEAFYGVSTDSITISNTPSSIGVDAFKNMNINKLYLNAELGMDDANLFDGIKTGGTLYTTINVDNAAWKDYLISRGWTIQ